MYVEDVEDMIINFGVHSTVYRIYVKDIEDMIINFGVHSTVYRIYVEDVEDMIINFGVHSTVYRIYVEDIEDIQMYMYLFQEDDPDKHKTWFELGADIGLEIVEDEEVEAEVDEIEVEEEVARIYEDAKKRHRKIMTGGFK